MAKKHVKITINTKPPHEIIRREACTCEQGADHTVYGHK